MENWRGHWLTSKQHGIQAYYPDLTKEQLENDDAKCSPPPHHLWQMIWAWKEELDCLAAMIARTCQWDLEASTVRPHITPDQLEFVEDMVLGTMEYRENRDNLTPAQSSTSATVTDPAMDTTSTTTSTQGAADTPASMDAQTSALHTLLAGQAAMREIMDQVASHQTQVTQDLSFERQAHQATKE